MGVSGLVVAGALVVAGLVGCDNSGDAPSDLEAAQANVAAKEKALEGAKADFAEKSDAFCGSSKIYIEALDRYGDVLTQTAATVGDVNDAGADLDDPRDEAESGAEDAVDAHQAVFDAQQELADAKAALAEVKSPGSADSSSPSGSSSPKPLVPATTVSRVKQAETELKAVQRGISEDTLWIRPRSSSTPPSSPWRCLGCVSSRTPAASPTRNRRTPRRRSATTPRPCSSL